MHILVYIYVLHPWLHILQITNQLLKRSSLWNIICFLQFQDVTGDTFHMLALRVPSITALASISEMFQNRSELQETDSLGTRATARMEITLLMTV